LDLVVVEDALSWPLEDAVGGAWESVSLLGELGIDEVRCYLEKQPTVEAWLEAIEGMQGVVERVHRA
jgi:hypothetical protein